MHQDRMGEGYAIQSIGKDLKIRISSKPWTSCSKISYCNFVSLSGVSRCWQMGCTWRCDQPWPHSWDCVTYGVLWRLKLVVNLKPRPVSRKPVRCCLTRPASENIQKALPEVGGPFCGWDHSGHHRLKWKGQSVCQHACLHSSIIFCSWPVLSSSCVWNFTTMLLCDLELWVEETLLPLSWLCPSISSWWQIVRQLAAHFSLPSWGRSLSWPPAAVRKTALL